MLRKLLLSSKIFLLILFYCWAQDDPCTARHSPKKLSNAIDDCRADNATAKVCNDRGQCICGFCECFYRTNPTERIYGKYCECDNFSCERVNSRLCNGHGICSCGTCHCSPGWTGTGCDCSTSTASCIDPENNDGLCNGHGECVCGECNCQEDQDGRYTGRYCQRYKKKMSLLSN
ncbi:integrin beta-PS-like [Vespa velutina]|uniref:integrin beta-PS-like n=1 Tax=Vespa velutina TaxID=202808 RepID=UPI001FB43FE6|nr:integrin beta-PS-like [Vespa velutina]